MLFFVAIKLNLPRQIDEMAVRLRIKGDEDDGNWFNNDENRSWGFPRNHLLGLNREVQIITLHVIYRFKKIDIQK